MIELLLAVLVLAVIVGVIVLVLRSRSSAKPSRSSGARRVDPLANQPDVYDPHKIGVGDVITYAGIDHVVRGTIVLEEGG
ncbi:MAG: DUF4178 domain-containing protein, partial [Gammaproteobacteria bacterium]